MNDKELEFGLRSLEADAALEALERRQRGEPARPDSPLTEPETDELLALGGDLGEGFGDRKADELLRALQLPDAAAAPSGARSGSRGQGVSLDHGARTPGNRRRLKQIFYAAAPLAAAAGFVLWLLPFAPLDTVVEPVQLQASTQRGAPAPSTGPSAAASTASAATLRIPRDGCFNVRVPLKKSATPLSDDLTAHAYLISEGHPVQWKLSLWLDPTGVLGTTAGCQYLPQGVAGKDLELVILVGFPGRLWWHGDAALRHASGEHGEYRGIQYVRRSLQLVSSPAELNQ